jgi:hypothetical protein
LRHTNTYKTLYLYIYIYIIWKFRRPIRDPIRPEDIHGNLQPSMNE